MDKEDVVYVYTHTHTHTYTHTHTHTWGFPDGSDSKESACNARDLGSIPGLGRCPGGGHGNPLQYSGVENPHGQRSLVGYSSWSIIYLKRKWVECPNQKTKTG